MLERVKSFRVSDAVAAQNDKLLQSFGITHIANAAVNDGVGVVFPEKLEYHCVALDDSSDGDIESALPPSASFHSRCACTLRGQPCICPLQSRNTSKREHRDVLLGWISIHGFSSRGALSLILWGNVRAIQRRTPTWGLCPPAPPTSKRGARPFKPEQVTGGELAR
jgi:hypothetical protein